MTFELGPGLLAAAKVTRPVRIPIFATPRQPFSKRRGTPVPGRGADPCADRPGLLHCSATKLISDVTNQTLKTRRIAALTHLP